MLNLNAVIVGLQVGLFPAALLLEVMLMSVV